MTTLTIILTDLEINLQYMVIIHHKSIGGLRRCTVLHNWASNKR